MTTTKNERQQWLDFAHTVDVATASALATSDHADMPGRGLKTAAGRTKFTEMLGPFSARRVIGGALVAACLLLVAVPVVRLLETGPGGGNPVRQPGDGLPPGVDTVREPGDGRPQALDLKVDMARTRYLVGDPLSFTLQTNRDCHLLVYSIGPSNEVTFLDPTLAGAPAADTVLSAGPPLQITAPGGQGPAAISSARGGYTIGALCSSEALGAGLASLRDAAQQGGPSFLSYLDGLLSSAKPEQLAETRATFEVQ